MYREPHWSDTFTPSMKQLELIAEKAREFLEEVADVCKLDTSDWTEDDYDILREEVGYL